MSRRARKAPSSTSAQRDLVVAPPEQRAVALCLERDRLLKEIDRRRRELVRAQGEIEAATVEIRSAVGSLVAQQSAIEQEVHALFAALLAAGRLTKRKRAQVRRIYVSLQRDGLIGPSVVEPADDRMGLGDDGAYDGSANDTSPGGRPAADPEPPLGPSASKPPGDENHRTLRTLFKRLVVALHPDRARHEDEKASRTAAMKDVTRAYESGDLAQLIELGRRLAGGSTPTKRFEDRALAVDMLERTVFELKAQLRALLDELRELRRSEEFRATKDLGRFRKAGEDPIEMMKAEEQARLDDLEAARDFVAAFQAGKIGFDEFVQGPSLPSDALEDAAAELSEMLDQLLIELYSPAPGRPRGRRRRPDSIPF